MKSSTVLSFAIGALGMAIVAAAPVQAATPGCSASDFGAVVDQTAQALRDLNLNGAKRFQEKMASLRQKNGLSQDEIEARAAAIQDEKIEEFNRDIDNLVNRMDALSQTPNNQVTCEKLAELKRVRDQLLTLMGQKSGYMLARADSLLDKPSGTARAPKVAVNTAVTEQPATGGETTLARTEPKAEPPKTEPKPDMKVEVKPEVKQPEVKPDVKPVQAKPEPKPVTKPTQNTMAPSLPERRPPNTQTASNNWKTEHRTVGRPTPAPSTEAPVNIAPQGQAGLPPLPPPGTPVDATFSVSEIRDAGRGIFGTITAEFAGAIDYAFQKFGQPNAYITGGEGGGAFLAGLRYGKGHLVRKGMADTPIFWQGPSAGLDLGAEGSKTLFLVYNLDDPEGIYGRFSGIGGSAYVAGGVGINVLGKGRVVMVPIRSGIGLRLGANLAYLKFTDRQTWNPF